MQTVIDTVVSTFQQRGGEKYADEGVTQQQHALQCADLARNADVPDSLVVAALLHDIGHILGDTDLPPDRDVNLDDRHETVGYDFLTRHFGADVAEPVGLHVAAKRYLCTAEPAYQEKLSPTSLKSFHDQGGLMDDRELDEFRNHPFFEPAIQLRRWDDLAKVTDKDDLSINDFLPQMRQVLTDRKLA